MICVYIYMIYIYIPYIYIVYIIYIYRVCHNIYRICISYMSNIYMCVYVYVSVLLKKIEYIPCHI